MTPIGRRVGPSLRSRLAFPAGLGTLLVARFASQSRRFASLLRARIMIRKSLAALAIPVTAFVVFITVLHADSQEPGGPPGGFGPGMFLGPRMIEIADADQDGELSPAEASKAAEKLVREADTEKKGSVDAQALGLRDQSPVGPHRRASARAATTMGRAADRPRISGLEHFWPRRSWKQPTRTKTNA